MRTVVTRAAGRGALAGIALAGGVLAAVEIADYKQRGNLKFATSAPGGLRGLPNNWFYWVTPWWVYAIAVTVSLLGLVLSLSIYRGLGYAAFRQLRKL